MNGFFVSKKIFYRQLGFSSKIVVPNLGLEPQYILFVLGSEHFWATLLLSKSWWYVNLIMRRSHLLWQEFRWESEENFWIIRWSSVFFGQNSWKFWWETQKTHTKLRNSYGNLKNFWIIPWSFAFFSAGILILEVSNISSCFVS